MIKLGFAARWVELIMRSISLVSYVFMLNEEIQGSLVLGKGIR